MKIKTFAAFILSLSVLTFGTVLFIKKSNDHKECERIIKYSVTKDGQKIKYEQHICNEDYSF